MNAYATRAEFEDAIDTRWQWARVLEVVESDLTDTERQALTLFMLGHSADRIGPVLVLADGREGVSGEAARQAVHRALRKIHARLGGSPLPLTQLVPQRFGGRAL